MSDLPPSVQYPGDTWTPPEPDNRPEFREGMLVSGRNIPRHLLEAAQSQCVWIPETDIVRWGPNGRQSVRIPGHCSCGNPAHNGPLEEDTIEDLT